MTHSSPSNGTQGKPRKENAAKEDAPPRPAWANLNRLAHDLAAEWGLPSEEMPLFETAY